MKWKLIVAAAVMVSLIAGLRLTVDQWDIWQAGPAYAAPAAPDRFIAAGGCVEPASEARELAATVVGRLTMTVAEGDHVSAGGLTAEVENADLKAQLAAAQANQIARANELARLKAGARVQEIAEAKAAVREAEAVAVHARTNFERQAAFGAKQIVSQEDVERAQADRDAAFANPLFRGTVLAGGDRGGPKNGVTDIPEDGLATKRVGVWINRGPGVQLRIKPCVDIRIEEPQRGKKLPAAAEPPHLRGEATAF